MIKKSLPDMYEKWAGEEIISITPLPLSGSNRKYFRIRSEHRTAIGVENADNKENIAYIEFSKHFLNQGLNVPAIYDVNLEKGIYLIEDLNDTTLFSFLSEERTGVDFSDDLKNIYKKALSILPEFQIKASENFPYHYCYPRSEFDSQSMQWDLNYFKYYFLKLAQVYFDEQALEDDFNKLIAYLVSERRDYFMYRDFQSRNIMLYNDGLYFIDFQGGRKGPLHYDVASLLYDAKANIPNHVREELLDHYMQCAGRYTELDVEEFRSKYYGFVLIRIMQAMGAYGFRGFYEKKAHFLASIPYALENLKEVLSKLDIPVKLKTLIPVLNELVKSERLLEIGSDRKKLTISINSFSYRRGIPVDESGHGGGFVFDCRVLDNPGRYEEYRNLTGKDLKVIEFLESNKEVLEFFENIVNIAEISIKNYLQREFNHLMISFGCTGGQHRSVFMAEKTANHIKNNYNVNVSLRHREMEMHDMKSK